MPVHGWSAISPNRCIASILDLLQGDPKGLLLAAPRPGMDPHLKASKGTCELSPNINNIDWQRGFGGRRSVYLELLPKIAPQTSAKPAAHSTHIRVQATP
jgi:hypothetical protein